MLTCCIFLDTIRKHDINGSETKDNLLLIIKSVVKILAHLCQPPSLNCQNVVWREKWQPHMQRIVLQQSRRELRESKYFIMVRCCSLYDHFWKKYSRIKTANDLFIRYEEMWEIHSEFFPSSNVLFHSGCFYHWFSQQFNFDVLGSDFLPHSCALIL